MFVSFTAQTIVLALVIAGAVWLFFMAMGQEKAARIEVGGWLSFWSVSQGVRVISTVDKPEGPGLLYRYYTEELATEAALLTAELRDYHISKSIFDREATMMYIDYIGADHGTEDTN